MILDTSAIVAIFTKERGDCLSYATARLAQRPLLCVGDDFAKAGLPLA